MEWPTLFEISLDRANQLYTWGWRLSAFGAVMTMIGIAILWTGTRVRDHDFEEQVATLHKSASASDERAKLIARDTAVANERAAIAEERAAEATKAAEQEKLARLKIEQRLADRQLSDAQLLNIAAKLQAYVEQEYGITTFWDLKEPMAIADRIYKSLQIAKWKFIRPEKTGFLLGGLAGVQVWIHPAANPRVKSAAVALVDALNSEGVEAMIKEQNPQSAATDRINLNVGTKP